MSKHTPGPWKAEPSIAHFWMVDGQTGTVAHGCWEADAKLIAAAPDLLAALGQCIHLATLLNEDHPHPTLRDIVSVARNAYAAAEEAGK